MRNHLQFYIGGTWINPARADTIDVINPATEEVAGRIAAGTAADVDRAVVAARAAFPAFAATSVAQRLDLLRAISSEYAKRLADFAEAITLEMGAPTWLAEKAQAPLGKGHIDTAIAVLADYPFEQVRGTTTIVREPIGVCGLITPWNWPVNQIAAKVVPALATGCTVVLKPSEIAPFSAIVWTEVLHAAGVPAGVFNLINGDGPTVGAAIAAHPGIDMVSFTGSTRAGIEVARNAAPSVKRVHQELGGKSPNIVLPDADLAKAVSAGVQSVMTNTGQTCAAPTRMLVPRARRDEAIEIARTAAEGITAGAPDSGAYIGPLVSAAQFDKVQRLIETGLAEGARLIAGGPGRPEHLNRGYYARPTVFADVTNTMTIAREEIFGPVLCILNYDDVAEAVAIANDTPYGLSAYVQTGNLENGRRIARQLRAGQVTINQPGLDMMAPFGGYGMSGNGREWGDHAFGEFLETKAILGDSVAA